MRWIPILAALAVVACQSCSANDTAATSDQTQSDDVSAANLDGHTNPPICAPVNGQQCVVGQPIMDFSLSDCTGKKWNAQELLRNHQKALIYFTAGWFNPKQLDPIGQLQSWHETFGSDVRIGAVLLEDQGVTTPATTELCNRWTDENDVDFLVLIDPNDELTSSCFDVRIPTAIAVDCDGTVYYQSELLPADNADVPPI